MTFRSQHLLGDELERLGLAEEAANDLRICRTLLFTRAGPSSRHEFPRADRTSSFGGVQTPLTRNALQNVNTSILEAKT